jgi:hypothetical protein
MQTLMELIKICINKEFNANPNDVSPNASPNVFNIEAITKAQVSTTTKIDSQPTRVEAKQFHGIA